MSKQAIRVLDARIAFYNEYISELKTSVAFDEVRMDAVIVRELEFLRDCIASPGTVVITRPSSKAPDIGPYTPFSFTFCDHLFVRKDVYWQACEKCGTLKPIAP